MPTFFFTEPSGLNKTKNWGGLCTYYAMLVQWSPRWAIVFQQGDAGDTPPTKTHRSELAAIGWEGWLAASFPACSFNKSRSWDQLPLDKGLYTWDKCWSVSSVLDLSLLQRSLLWIIFKPDMVTLTIAHDRCPSPFIDAMNLWKKQGRLFEGFVTYHNIYILIHIYLYCHLLNQFFLPF